MKILCEADFRFSSAKQCQGRLRNAMRTIMGEFYHLLFSLSLFSVGHLVVAGF